MAMKRILVPTDFSTAAERALDQASLLARRFGAEVHLLHRPVYRVPEPPPSGLDGPARLAALDRLMNEYLTDPQQRAREQLDQLVERLASKGVQADFRLETAREPFDAILDEVETWRPDLICMGTHGRSGLEKLLMGSLTEKVIRHVACDVLTVRGETETRLVGAGAGAGVRVLVPVDFSDYSQRALGSARELVADVGSGAIHLLHVVELEHAPFTPGGLTNPLDEEPGSKEKLEEALRGMLGGSSGDVTVRAGDIAGQILHLREEIGAELVVMGSRGRSGLSHILVGSVAERVARFCESPVWIVK